MAEKAHIGAMPAHVSMDAAASLFLLIDTFAAVSRDMHPPRLGALASRVQQPADLLRQAQPQLSHPALQEAATLMLRASDGLVASATADHALADAYRAMRYYQRAVVALIAAESLPSVSAFLLPPSHRQDLQVLARLTPPVDGQSGILHCNNDLTMRGGFSAYVPPLRGHPAHWPVIMALHGGSGHGRLFLSNWVPLARMHGFIVIAPTATGSTWSLMDPPTDASNLTAILERVAERWPVDRSRLLLTGMSDGGTFTLLSGLDLDAPFTHLAPVAASFHPMLLSFAEPDRMSGLPVYLTHGALDWMFPVSVGRTAARALNAAGASVVYREVADLSHTYPVDEQPAILDWFLRTPAQQASQ